MTAVVGALLLASWSVVAMASSDASRTVEPLRLGHEARVVVVAPHPDDETIAAGGLMRRLEAAGAHAVLVGEALMREPDVGLALARLRGAS